MNFLAHCVLAHPGEGFLAGGVLGDFIKGPIGDDLPQELAAGVLLHRRIDSYSNRLPAMKVSIDRFDPALRRAAPVLLDIVADHCLALDWPRVVGEEMRAFTGQIYAAVAQFESWLPASSHRFVAHMVETDLLARYDDATVIRRALQHVLERLRMTRLDALLDAVLDDNLPALRDDFRGYFPQLQAFAQAERSRMAVPAYST